MRKSQRILLWTGDCEGEGGEDEAEEAGEREAIDGIIRDPSLGGHKELFMLYSKEFQVRKSWSKVEHLFFLKNFFPIFYSKEFLRERRNEKLQPGRLEQLERIIRPFLSRWKEYYIRILRKLQ